jgi:hypothetical protein
VLINLSKVIIVASTMLKLDDGIFKTAEGHYSWSSEKIPSDSPFMRFKDPIWSLYDQSLGEDSTSSLQKGQS